MTTDFEQTRSSSAAPAAARRCSLAHRAGRASRRRRRSTCCAIRCTRTCLTTGAAGDVHRSPGARRTRPRSPGRPSTPIRCRIACFARRASSETDFGVGYLIDNRADAADRARCSSRSTTIRPADPIEDFDDIAPGLSQGDDRRRQARSAFRSVTRRRGCSTTRRCWRRRGIAAPPKTLEELVEQAKKLTFTSAAGTPVVGMVLASDLAVFPVMFARAFGGDFITRRFQGRCPNRAAMEKGLAVLRDLFEAGALPRSYATTTQRRSGDLAAAGAGRLHACCRSRATPSSTTPEQSQFPGKIKAVEFPARRRLPTAQR